MTATGFDRPVDRALMALRLAGITYVADPERADRWLTTCPTCGGRLVMLEGEDESLTLRCGSGCDPYHVQIVLDAYLPRGDGIHAAPLATVSRERVEWLSPGRVPLGMLTLLIGDPGLGKSLLMLMLAAEVSRQGGNVLILSAEDHAGATIRPRAEAAGADLDRVRVVTVRRDGVDDGLALPDDAHELEQIAAETDARLVGIDPLMAHLPESVNSWRDQSVRRALAPLHRLAEAQGAAVVVVAHLNKARGGDPLYRAGGSIGIPAAVRSALLLARDPDDDERGNRRVLAHVKCNIGPQAESLSCEIEPVLLDGDEPITTAAMRVTGTSEVSASALLDAPIGAERTERDDAADFLRTELADGPRPAKEIIAAAVEAGHHRRTIERAKAELGIKSQRVGGAAGGGRWEWSLNTASPKSATPISPTGGLSVNGSSKPSMDVTDAYDRHESDMAALGGSEPSSNGHANPNIAAWERLQEMSR